MFVTNYLTVKQLLILTIDLCKLIDYLEIS